MINIRTDSDIVARIATTLTIIGLMVVLTAFDAWPTMFKRMENILYDWRLNLSLEQQTDWRVVIIDIDEASLAEEGQWPWPRDKVAQLLSTLNNDYGVSQIGLDIIFPEISNVPEDLTLAQAIVDTNTVAAVAFAIDPANNELQQGKLGDSIEVMDTGIQDDFAIAAHGYIGNNLIFPIDYFMGHINPLYDIDGKVRQFAPLIEYEGKYYGTLAMAMVCRLFDVHSLAIRHRSQSWLGDGLMSSHHLAVPGLVDIPINQNGQAWLPLQRPAGSYRYISAADILNKRLPADALLGTFALVGTSASGLHDLVATPLAINMPGVEVHAHQLSAILDANFLTISDYTPYIIAISMLIMGGIMIIGSYWQISYFNFLLALTLIGLWLVANHSSWVNNNAPLPILAPVLFVILIYLLMMAFNYNQSKGEGKRLLSSLQKYVPAPVVKAAVAREQALIMPEEREATILFMDIRGFTTLAEYHSAHKTNTYVASIMEKVSELVESNGGIIDKYIGDAIMVFWDSDQWPDHADRAVKSALQIDQYFTNFELPAPHLALPLQFGIGINTGRVMIGQMGTNIRASYTVMGDAVNVASRLQGISQSYHSPIIVGAGTAASLQDIPYQQLGQINLRGREQPETIYTPAVSAG